MDRFSLWPLHFIARLLPQIAKCWWKIILGSKSDALRGERGMIEDTHSLRQVCHTGYEGKPERFYGNSFCFLAHMAGRQLPEQGRMSNQNNGTASCRCAEREQGGTGGSPSLRAHRQPLDCQAADSTAAIL